MLEFRKRKRLCRTTWRKYKKQNITHTPYAQQIKKTWLKLVRQHNRRRVTVETRSQKQTTAKANTSFKRDPFAYADKLFNKQKNKTQSSFSKESADTYCHNTYTDRDRGYCYEQLDDSIRPPPPTVTCHTTPLTLSALLHIILKKRNKAKPGFNGLPYVIYKKCMVIIHLIHKIFIKI